MTHRTTGHATDAPENLPPHLNELLASLPENLDRRAAAEIISRHLFPVSHRSLESWTLPTRRVNGRAVFSSAAVLALAWRKLSAAPVIMSGRRERHVRAGKSEPITTSPDAA